MALPQGVMMGLLDPTNDPGTMGLLSLGLGLLGSKGSFGSALSQAGPQALQAMQQVKDRQRLAEQDKQQAAMRALQMQQAQMQLAEAQRAQVDRERQQQFLQGLPSPQMAAVSQTLAGGGGPSMANAARVPAVDPMQQLMFGAVKAGALPLSSYITSMQKDETPVALAEGGKLVTKSGRELANNPKAPDLNSLVVMGPDGKPMINQLAFNAKRDLARAGASSVSVNTDNLGLKPKDRFEMEQKLSGDYSNATKLDRSIVGTAEDITNILRQGGALKDQAAIYKFAKALDPEGAVREADYAAIVRTAGGLDYVKALVNKALTGEQLLPKQREEMARVVNAMAEVAKNRIGQAQRKTGSNAKLYNLNPDNIFSAADNDGWAIIPGSK